MAAFSVSDSSIIIGQTVIFTDESSANTESWFWEFERGNPETFNGQVPPPIQYNILGAYDVTLTVTNNAGKSVKYKPGFIQVGTTGVQNSPAGEIMNIYPNPVTSGEFMVEFQNRTYSRINILTLPGTIIQSTETNSDKLVLHVPGIDPGLYFIRVTDLLSGKVSIRKLIIQ
jgi:PKD repeat protein